ncbi:MAG TPA: hypothetical protein VGZ22_21160, partial [Isosphaeraceae bacterium]|nr:hypothetical protein [Isosphaeraceae bacterium]
ITRFPVTGHGQRNDAMIQIIGSLLGRACSRALTFAVTLSWWQYYHGLGVIATHPDEARTEIAKSMECMLRSPDFQPSSKRSDREASWVAFELDERQIKIMHAPIQSQNHQPKPTPPIDKLFPAGLIGGCLCKTEQEMAFVEALLVAAVHEYAQGGVLQITNEQIRQIAHARHDGLSLHTKAFEALKTLYISRPGRPAKRHELLSETLNAKGPRVRGAAIASEYAITGLATLLAAATTPAEVAAHVA